MSNPNTSLGLGATVSVGTSPTLTAIAGVVDAKFSGQKVNIDKFTLQNAPGGRVTKVPTTVDEGDFTFSVIYDPADTTHIDLRTTFLQTVKDWKVVEASGDSYAFSGTIESAIPDYNVDKVIRLQVKVSITGEVTRTAA